MATDVQEPTLDLVTWGVAVRRRWWRVAVGAAVGAGLSAAALAFVEDTAPVYASEATVYVPVDSAEDAMQIETYAALALRDTVVDRPGVGRAARRQLSASVDADPRTIRLRAVAGSPIVAYALATAWQVAFASEVAVEIYIAAALPVGPEPSTSRRPGLIAVALVISIGAGLFAAGWGTPGFGAPRFREEGEA